MAYYRIHNKGTLWRHEEAVAVGTISPGMLCEMTATPTVQAHSVEGGLSERLIALEDALQGRGVNTNYSATEIVTLALAAPGEVFNMLMAIGEDGAPGDKVVSAGDGTLKCVDNIISSAMIKQIIGEIDASEAAFTTLAAVTLKAIRLR